MAWIVASIVGLAPNEKQVGDRGIEGRGRMITVPDGEKGLGLAQVKGGGYKTSSLRDFQGTMAREKASAGIFVTLDSVIVHSARVEALKMGTHRIGVNDYLKLQFGSVAEYIEGILPRLPPMVDSYTSKAIRPEYDL